MSNERKHSKLGELIRELCPDGVEYRSIGNCTEKVKKIKWSTCGSNYAYIDLTSVDRDTHKITETQTINANNAPSRAQQIVLKNDVLFATTRPTLMRYCLIEDKYDGQICSTGFCVLRANKDIVFPKWLFHVISSSEFCYYMEANQKGASYPAISDKEVKQFKIPLPPLPVQREIVRILDKFTELTEALIAELTMELTTRKKQYEFYRDKLLTFGDVRGRATSDVVWRTLGEIASIKTGRKPDNIFETDIGNYVEYINAGTSKSGYVDKPNFSGDTVTTPSRGQGGIGFVGYQKNAFWLGPLCYGIKAKNKEVLSNRYLYHFLCSRTNAILQRKNEGGTPSLNLSDLQAIDICCPSLDVQKRIVNVLDNFDAICSDLKIGLPAEIDARKKQYEFYLEKLLAFHEISN